MLLIMKNIKNEILKPSLFDSNISCSNTIKKIPDTIIMFLIILVNSSPMKTPSSQNATVPKIKIDKSHLRYRFASSWTRSRLVIILIIKSDEVANMNMKMMDKYNENLPVAKIAARKSFLFFFPYASPTSDSDA